MADDPRHVLMRTLVESPAAGWRVVRAMDPHDDLLRLLMADAALAALEQAGWRVVRADDLRWLVEWMKGNPSVVRYDEISRPTVVNMTVVPPGVRALLDEMEEEGE